MTLPSNRITLVTLAVKDLDRSRAFYEALGWIVEEATPDAVFFDMMGQKFGLYRWEMLAKDLDAVPDKLGTGAMSIAQNQPSKAEVDRAYAHARQCGAVACKPPEEVFWGGYSGTFRDPDGHVWEVAFNPFWTLDTQGRIAT